MHIKENKTSLV